MPNPPIVCSASAALRALKPFRRGKKIVFTNGCFDLIHRGHADYLARARKQGDVLVVGLNTDASVRRLKGPTRPINSLSDRAAVLSAIRSVDIVVPFSEDTPERLIRAICPDVLAKGADYSESEIVGADFVRSRGGRVVRIPLTPGRSTSKLVQKMSGSAKSKVLIVIPARYGSTRFPGKALATIGGKTILHRVWERAVRAARPGWKIVVATDDKRIAAAARAFGAEVAMTPVSCTSGSDRCARVAEKFPEYPVVVNLQGDEPFQSPANIRLAVQTLLSSDSPVATLAAACPKKDFENPNVAKVAIAKGGAVAHAVYFSRSRIPFFRDLRDQSSARLYKHIGLYVFRREFLLEFARWKPTPLESAEKLEQLRILEHGRPIAIAVTSSDSIGIDTPADLARARRMRGL